VAPKWLAVAGACTALITSGCGSDGPPTYHQADAKVPACAHAGKAIALPHGFPANFPFPPHTALTSHTRSFGAIIVEGIVPASSFDDAQSFFTKKLPDAGYTLSEQDAEPPREAEARYSGKGYEGGWRIRLILSCPGAFTLQASAAPRPTKS
jgi:hypothetical protein